MPNSIAGEWKGELTQQGLGSFEVAVDIDPQGPTRVAYTEINCGGHWVLRLAGESNPPVFVIDELITEGAGDECEGSGLVTLRPLQRKQPYQELNYGFEGGDVASLGNLTRTDAAGLEAVFEEAGVTPPSG